MHNSIPVLQVKWYKANSFPDYYIIDRKGILRWADIVNRDVEKAIKHLLAEQPEASSK